MKLRIEMRSIDNQMLWCLVNEADEIVSFAHSFEMICDAKEKVEAQRVLTQREIDGVGRHRRGFLAHVLQIKRSVFPSTQSIVE